MHLRRNVSLFSATVYGVGIILGAGVYALIGEATGLAGNSVWLSFVIAAIVSSFTGLSYMELISMFPQSAAEYVYAKQAFKNRLVAFNIGWIEIFADIIATSAVSLGDILSGAEIETSLPETFGSGKGLSWIKTPPRQFMASQLATQ